MERRIVAQIMACIDELGNNMFSLDAPVFIIGATSKPEFIDSSVRRSGRFDKEIHIGFPNESMREKMLLSLARNKRLDKEVDFLALAKLTTGYLAADLQSLLREAGRIAIKRILTENNSSQLSNFISSTNFSDENNLNLFDENSKQEKKVVEININTVDYNLSDSNGNCLDLSLNEKENHANDVTKDNNNNSDLFISLKLKMEDFEEVKKYLLYLFILGKQKYTTNF